MNGHQIQMNCHWIQINGHRIEWTRWMVIKIRNKLVETITSKHYFTLTPIYCHIGKVFRKIHHLQTLFHTLSYILSNWKWVHQNPITSKHYITLSKKLQAKPSQAKSVREKKGRASFENSMNGHFSARGIRPKETAVVRIEPRVSRSLETPITTTTNSFNGSKQKY